MINFAQINVLTNLIQQNGWSLLPHSFRVYNVQLYHSGVHSHSLPLKPYCSILEDTSSFNSSIVLNSTRPYHDPFHILSRKSEIAFHFKHPRVTSCNQPGECGFILKTVPTSEELLWKLELCTKEEDYHDKSVHFHQEIRAEKMHVFFCRRLHNESYIFPLSRLTCISFANEIKGWKNWFEFHSGSRFCVLYCLDTN